MGFFHKSGSSPKFALGQTVATVDVVAFAQEHSLDLSPYFLRHCHGDWGNVEESDRRRNDLAVVEGDTIHSKYLISVPGKGSVIIWVITEHDRSVTTILFPSDY